MNFFKFFSAEPTIVDAPAQAEDPALVVAKPMLDEDRPLPINDSQKIFVDHFRQRKFLTHAERKKAGRNAPFARIPNEFLNQNDTEEVVAKVMKELVNKEVNQIFIDMEDADKSKSQRVQTVDFHYDVEPSQIYRYKKPRKLTNTIWYLLLSLMILPIYVGLFIPYMIVASYVIYDDEKMPIDEIELITNIYCAVCIIIHSLLMYLICTRESDYFSGKHKLVKRTSFEFSDHKEMVNQADWRSESNNTMRIKTQNVTCTVVESITFVRIEERKETDVTEEIMRKNEMTFDQLTAIRKPLVYMISSECYSELTGPAFMDYEGDLSEMRENMRRSVKRFSHMNFDRYDHGTDTFMNNTVRVAHAFASKMAHKFRPTSF
jgi:hypothetical protein